MAAFLVLYMVLGKPLYHHVWIMTHVSICVCVCGVWWGGWIGWGGWGGWMGGGMWGSCVWLFVCVVVVLWLCIRVCVCE